MLNLANKVRVLLDKTIAQFGYDPSNCHHYDNKLIVVQCISCGEEFYRELHMVNWPHACLHSDLDDSQPPRCEFKLINSQAKIPTRAKRFDAGLDISSIIDQVLLPNKSYDMPTGVIISAPPGYYFTIEGRSGLFRKNIFPLRGIIDSSYSAETKVTLFNASDVSYHVKVGDRIAQLLFHKVRYPDFVMVDDFSPDYCKRGDAGYGSTGR